MTFSFQPVFWATLALGWVVACLKTHRGPLALLGLAVTHARAVLLCARREIGKMPERCRQQYPLAVCEVRRLR